jgi:hypothetical protein
MIGRSATDHGQFRPSFFWTMLSVEFALPAIVKIPALGLIKTPSAQIAVAVVGAFGGGSSSLVDGNTQSSPSLSTSDG